MIVIMTMLSRRQTTTLTRIISRGLTVNSFHKGDISILLQIVELCLQSGARARNPKVGL